MSPLHSSDHYTFDDLLTCHLFTFQYFVKTLSSVVHFTVIMLYCLSSHDVKPPYYMKATHYGLVPDDGHDSRHTVVQNI